MEDTKISFPFVITPELRSLSETVALTVEEAQLCVEDML